MFFGRAPGWIGAVLVVAMLFTGVAVTAAPIRAASGALEARGNDGEVDLAPYAAVQVELHANEHIGVDFGAAANAAVNAGAELVASAVEKMRATVPQLMGTVRAAWQTVFEYAQSMRAAQRLYLAAQIGALEVRRVAPDRDVTDLRRLADAVTNAGAVAFLFADARRGETPCTFAMAAARDSLSGRNPLITADGLFADATAVCSAEDEAIRQHISRILPLLARVVTHLHAVSGFTAAPIVAALQQHPTDMLLASNALVERRQRLQWSATMLRLLRGLRAANGVRDAPDYAPATPPRFAEAEARLITVASIATGTHLRTWLLAARALNADANARFPPDGASDYRRCPALNFDATGWRDFVDDPANSAGWDADHACILVGNNNILFRVDRWGRVTHMRTTMLPLAQAWGQSDAAFALAKDALIASHRGSYIPTPDQDHTAAALAQTDELVAADLLPPAYLPLPLSTHPINIVPVHASTRDELRAMAHAAAIHAVRGGCRVGVNVNLRYDDDDATLRPVAVQWDVTHENNCLPAWSGLTALN